nr:hypothetical protein [Bacillus licheniformis]
MYKAVNSQLSGMRMMVSTVCSAAFLKRLGLALLQVDGEVQNREKYKADNNEG